MTKDKIPPRIGFLMFVAFATTMLFIMACTSFWRHDFRYGFVFLTLGTALSYLFFRRRLLALTTVALATIFVLAGMGSISRPSALGILLTLGSGAAAYLLVVWDTKKHPEHALEDWKTLWNNRPKG